jgi:uridine kinase
MKAPFFIGITGGSASGKTEFLKRLIGSFSNEQICLISQDNYYKSIEQQPKDHNGIANFDTPNSIDFDQFAADLRELYEGKTVKKLEYTFNNPLITPKELVFFPAPIVVVEGIFVFYESKLSHLFDLKVFIDAKEHIKLKRRILRDRLERGYDLEDVLYRYEHHVAPTYERYILPLKEEADIIVPNNVGFDKALSVIVAFLKTKIA